MEEYFEMCKGEEIIEKPPQPVSKEMAAKLGVPPIQPLPTPAQKKLGMSMVFNRIIHETINDLYLMNRLIEKKAKIVTALLSNGREISERKNNYWL